MIHPSAIIHPGALLGAKVSVGAYSIVGEHVEIGDDTRIGPHVVIEGRTRIGKGNRIFQFCSLGAAPQDKKYSDEPTRLEIGDGNTIREFCTLNCGTVQDAGVTRLGNDNWIMAYVHLAHDCQIGDHTIFANSAQIAGHVHVGDYAILGGFTGVHQFVRVGAHSFTAIATVLVHDLPPYVMAAGDSAKPYGINVEGLRRRGFSAESLTAIKRAYKTLYKSGLTLDQAKVQLAEQAATSAEIALLAEFLHGSTRGIVR
jgi:UDP-N-acetylglucosamine acyltransferase